MVSVPIAEPAPGLTLPEALTVTIPAALPLPESVAPEFTARGPLPVAEPLVLAICRLPPLIFVPPE